MRIRDRLRFPTMLEIFTFSAVFYALYLGEVIQSITLALLAGAWSIHHNESENNNELEKEN